MNFGYVTVNGVNNNVCPTCCAASGSTRGAKVPFPCRRGVSGPRLGTGLQFNSISHSMAFCQAFFSLSFKLFCEKIFNFFTILPWKTLLPQDIVALFCPCHNGRAGAFLMYYKLHYRNMDAQRFLWYTNLVSAALLKTLTEWMFYGFF